MPFQVCSPTGTSFVLTRLHGDVDLGDYLNLLYSITVKPGSLDGKQVICDARDGRVELSYDELETVTSFIRSHEDVFSGMKCAVVVNGILEFGLARSAGLMTSDLSFDYNVFDCIDQACNWVGIPMQQWAAHQQQFELEPA